ncbi:hypothetical protein HHI36_009381 [Cryptolaemus montrouzieri]|uniref:Uncharacterized protein n=1 Tax=Cryptolaemus montrouzieri TaxID=559131 RepID=A0ABD2MV26_9CUCU
MLNTVFTVTLLLILATAIQARPSESFNKTEENEEQYYNIADFDEVYDQKQNGTGNVRVDVSGVIVVMPSSVIPVSLFDLGNIASLVEALSKYSGKKAAKEEGILKQNSRTFTPSSTTTAETKLKPTEKKVTRDLSKHFGDLEEDNLKLASLSFIKRDIHVVSLAVVNYKAAVDKHIAEMYKFILISICIDLIAAKSIEFKNEDGSYDFSKFDEIYDQRQNGSVNVRLNVHDVSVILQTDKLDSSFLNRGAPSIIDSMVNSLVFPSSTITTESVEDFFNSTTPTDRAEEENNLDGKSTEGPLEETTVPESV